MQLDKGEYTQAHTTGGRPSLLATAGAAPACRRHSRCLLVLFVATVGLAPPLAPVLTQRPAWCVGPRHRQNARGRRRMLLSHGARLIPRYWANRVRSITGSAERREVIW